jgi:hypothetical protein
MVARIAIFLLMIGLDGHAGVGVPGMSMANPPEPVTVDSLRAWLKTGVLDAYPWPKEFQLDLKGDGGKEVFLATGGYSRGMSYDLFAKIDGKWVMLSDDIQASNQGGVLPQKTGGWHDFQTHTPSGRGGVDINVYSWDATQKKYTQKSFNTNHHQK